MESRFLYELGKKLIFHASFSDMKEIIEDYTQFSKEGTIAEKPKDIISSLVDAGHRALVIYMILGILCFCNMWLFIYIDSHRYLSFNIQFGIPLVLSILFPLIVFFAVGKKITVLSALYLEVKNNKILIYVINILICLVAPTFFGIKIFNIIDMHIIQNVLCIVATFGVILFGYCVLTRGASYYLGLCSSYILVCTLFQVKAIESQLTNLEVYLENIKMVFYCYLVAILLSVMWLTILSKRKKY
ncbi:MAG: hypothetical protein RR139_01960 [Lachnospiraceae bacterium]